MQNLSIIIPCYNENTQFPAPMMLLPVPLSTPLRYSREIQRKWPNVPDPACEFSSEDAASRFSRGALPDRCKQGKGDDSTEQGMEVTALRRLSYGEWVGYWGGLTSLLHAVREGHADVVARLLELSASNATTTFRADRHQLLGAIESAS